MRAGIVIPLQVLGGPTSRLCSAGAAIHRACVAPEVLSIIAMRWRAIYTLTGTALKS